MRSNRTGWLMLAPTLAILGTFGILPFIYVVYVAFHRWNTPADVARVLAALLT